MSYILLIDDDDLVRNMLRQQLERAGYEVVTASDGLEGLKLYHSRTPALIVTDLIMPEADGIETIIQLHNLDPNLPIIAISGGSRLVPTDMLLPAKLLGAARTFSKPVDIPELLAAIAELLSR